MMNFSFQMLKLEETLIDRSAKIVLDSLQSTEELPTK